MIIRFDMYGYIPFDYTAMNKTRISEAMQCVYDVLKYASPTLNCHKEKEIIWYSCRDYPNVKGHVCHFRLCSE